MESFLGPVPWAGFQSDSPLRYDSLEGGRPTHLQALSNNKYTFNGAGNFSSPGLLSHLVQGTLCPERCHQSGSALLRTEGAQVRQPSTWRVQGPQ